MHRYLKCFVLSGKQLLAIAATCFSIAQAHANANVIAADCFAVSDDALTLARQLNLKWNDLGYSPYSPHGGAPGVNLRQPYGSTKKSEDIKRIVSQASLTTNQAEQLHSDALKTFQILLRFGSVAAGAQAPSLANRKPIVVTADHLLLQKQFNFIDRVEEDEFGVDSKRPYGDRQCWELDMAEAIGEKAMGNDHSSCEKSFTQKQLNRIHTLHRSTLGLAKALLELGTLQQRKFKQDRFGVWEVCEK